MHRICSHDSSPLGQAGEMSTLAYATPFGKELACEHKQELEDTVAAYRLQFDRSVAIFPCGTAFQRGLPTIQRIQQTLERLGVLGG